VNTKDASTEVLARTVGYLSQNPNDYLHSDTVREEVEFTLKNFGIKEDAGGILALTGLSEKSGSHPRDLSGGERQRVALASVLAADPRVLVLDEPTRGVDHKQKIQLMEFLQKLCDSGKTTILVTHDIETIADRVDRVIVLDQGRVESDGSPREVLPKTRHFRTKVNEMFGGNLLTVADALEAVR
jgi:energy-coupling factor transport system ATP-binding protein